MKYVILKLDKKYLKCLGNKVINFIFQELSSDINSTLADSREASNEEYEKINNYYIFWHQKHTSVLTCKFF